MNQFPVINHVADQQGKLCEEKTVLSLRALSTEYWAGNCAVQSCVYIAHCINLALYNQNSFTFVHFVQNILK